MAKKKVVVQSEPSISKEELNEIENKKLNGKLTPTIEPVEISQQDMWQTLFGNKENNDEHIS